MKIEQFNQAKLVNQADLGYTSTPSDIYYPMQDFKEQVLAHPRQIENCWWFRPVKIDFDIQGGQPADSLQKDLHNKLSNSIQKQDHPNNGIPDVNSDMIIGFYDIPAGEGSLFERVEEIDPLIVQASKNYEIDAFSKNYTLVITINDDIASLPKRESEKITRMLMARLGALKILMIRRDDDGNADYYALGTMEGGLAIEDAKKEGSIDRLRDRVITHACAKDSGSFKIVENAISKENWEEEGIPEYIANASRTLAEWGYIDKPFELTDVCSDTRAKFIQKIMGYSRQSESAIAAHAYNLIPPADYKMGQIDGVIVSSKSGRFNVDKTQLKRNDTIPVAIVPNPDYIPGENDPLNLKGFKRYSLGIEGELIVGPSIEFDEMAAAILYSGTVRVSRHENGKGFRIDPNGKYLLPRIRAFIHIHQGVESVDFNMNINGNKLSDLFKNIPPNLDDYPYPVGCGKDIMFALSTDAARRLIEAAPVESGVQIGAFDAMDHGTNLLILTEPLPGTDFIPDNPFQVVLEILDKSKHAITLTDEIAQV